MEAFANLQLTSLPGQRSQQADDDYGDDGDDSKERRKIEIKFISDKGRRHITFSKRKAGIMKKVSNTVLEEARSRATTSAPSEEPRWLMSVLGI